MSLLSRAIEIGAGAGLAYAGVHGLINATEYIDSQIKHNDNAKGREQTSSVATNIGHFAVDNVTMFISGLDTSLKVPFYETSEASQTVMSNTAEADMIGIGIGYTTSAGVLITGLGLVTIGAFGRPSLDYSRRVSDKLHA